MKTLSLSEAKAKLSSLVDEVSQRDEEVVITRNGRPAAVLVAQKARKAKLYTLQELFK